MKMIAIIDYGLGNLYSLSKAFKELSYDTVITDDPTSIEKADAVVIPGVGAFASGMEGLRAKKLVEPLKRFADSGKPMLGICLGAQLLLSKGFEFGEYDGLGIIPGTVALFPATVTEKIPHIGWNGIYEDKNPTTETSWKGTIFNGLKNRSDVYFVHSYIMTPEDKVRVLAWADYGGVSFAAAVRKGNVFGTQFHPEKSGEIGLTIIRNFINLIK